MNSKGLWTIIASLILLNFITVSYFLSVNRGDIKQVEPSVEVGSTLEEAVASIGNITISRQEWLNKLESRYGQQTLEDMIDEIVIKKMADKYQIEISSETMEREMTMIKTMYHPLDYEKINDEHWREQIELSLLLEELVTKDAVISEDELKRFYDQNKELYDIPNTYHLSHIVVKTLVEAEQVAKELEAGSSFTALAMEKSIDEFSANQGGELGFVSADNEYVPAGYIDAASELNVNDWSKPIKVEEGYSIVLVHEFIQGVTYTYEDVKDQIKRQIAIEQVQGALSIQSFWEEAEVSWFYEKKQ